AVSSSCQTAAAFVMGNSSLRYCQWLAVMVSVSLFLVARQSYAAILIENLLSGMPYQRRSWSRSFLFSSDDSSSCAPFNLSLQDRETAGLALQGFTPVPGAGPFDSVPCSHFAQDDNLNSGFVGKY